MKNFLLLLIFSPMMILAANTMEKFDPVKEGLPVADGGVEVKPLREVSKGLMATAKNKILIAHAQIQDKGFYEVDNTKVRVILNMRNQKALPPGSNNPQDTHLKSTIADVGLAFPFMGVPGVDPINIVGYAAIGSYNNGWTGALI